jgi:hypothetical protein
MIAVKNSRSMKINTVVSSEFALQDLVCPSVFVRALTVSANLKLAIYMMGY